MGCEDEIGSGREMPGAVQVLYALIREAIPEAEFDRGEMGGEARGWIGAWQQGGKRLGAGGGGWGGGGGSRVVCRSLDHCVASLASPTPSLASAQACPVGPSPGSAPTAGTGPGLYPTPLPVDGDC